MENSCATVNEIYGNDKLLQNKTNSKTRRIDTWNQK